MTSIRSWLATAFCGLALGVPGLCRGEGGGFSFPAGFYRGAEISINYAGSETLTDFPVLVRLSETIEGFRYSDFYLPNGGDLCFRDSDGNNLPFEVDTWDTSGTSLVWVKIPALSAGTKITVSYRSSQPASAAGSVWSAFTGVWHLGEGGDGVQTVADSTVNRISGVTHQNSLAVAAGKIGGARRVTTVSGSSSNGKIRMPLNDSGKFAAVDALGSHFTVSFWMRMKGGADYAYLAGRMNENGDTMGWSLETNNDKNSAYNMAVIRFHGKTGRAWHQNMQPTSSGTGWRKIDLVYDGTNYVYYLDGGSNGWVYRGFSGYIGNGVGGTPSKMQNEATDVYADQGSRDLAFGGAVETGYGAFNGEMDEIRLAPGVRSAEWVAAAYANENGTEFVTVGSIQSASEQAVPVVAATIRDSGARFVQFAGTVISCGGAYTSCDFSAKVWKSGTEEPAASTVLETGVAGDATCAPAVTGLDPEAQYSYKIIASNGEYSSDVIAGTFTTCGTCSAGVGGHRVRLVNDYIHTFTRDSASDSGEFSFVTPSCVTKVRALVVAGGGAGGFFQGGGGGAGGLLYNAELPVTSGATYTINVGAGGVAATEGGSYGGNGEDSWIKLGDAEVLRALGGGAGGSYFNSVTNDAAGLAGGSGGGSAASNQPGGVGASGQGSDGGVGNGWQGKWSGNPACAGGGGGAGSVGANGSQDIPPSAGAGGVGFATDISGVLRYYAGGGGGGAHQTSRNRGNVTAAGLGGTGGGGTGGVDTAVDGGPDSTRLATSGENGTGGGGGGGSDCTGCEAGGNGGSGVVILRYTIQGSGAGSAEPFVTFNGLSSASAGEARVDYRVAWAGEGAERCALYARYGTDPEALDQESLVADGVIGTDSGTFRFAQGNAHYYVRLVAINGAAEMVSDDVFEIDVGDIPDPPVNPSGDDDPPDFQEVHRGTMLLIF